MIEVFQVPISKAQLRAMPLEERHLLLLASHAVNQISVVQKLLFFSVHYETNSDVENLLSGAQSQTILRLLFGILAESWEMVRRPVNQRVIGNDYIKVLGAPGVSAYEKLKLHFGKSNLLHQLRNTIAYHHPSSQDLEEAFNDVPEDEQWAWYPAERNLNSFYFASDMVISAGVLRVTGEGDPATAFDKVMREVLDVCPIMVDFFLYLMRAIVTRHLGESLLTHEPGTGIKIAHAPRLDEIAIPFFTEPGEGTPRRWSFRHRMPQQINSTDKGTS